MSLAGYWVERGPRRDREGCRAVNPHATPEGSWLGGRGAATSPAYGEGETTLMRHELASGALSLNYLTYHPRVNGSETRR